MSGVSALQSPQTKSRALSLCFFVTAFGAGILLLSWDTYLLWKPRADQVSGDTLIHLIFARNFLEGRMFEFNPGESSRALTSLLWNGLLVLAGGISGLANHNEGFLQLARVLSAPLLIGTCWIAYQLSVRFGSARGPALVGCILAAACPITFYWTVANPMETAMALLLAICLLALLHRILESKELSFRDGIWLGGVAILLFLNRPEFVVTAGIAAGVAILLQRNGAVRFVLGFLVAGGVGAFGYFAFFWLAGLDAFPSANQARRIMVAMAPDAISLPWSGWVFSRDALLLTAAFFPLPLGGLILLFRRENPSVSGCALFALLSLAFGVLFFSVYFPTTWQGRYLLPFYFLLLPVSLAGWSLLTGKFARWLPIPMALFFVPVFALVMRPLAGYAKAPLERAKPIPTFWTPSPSDRTVLCNEVQGAYFYPHLQFISSEGLIAGEAMDARSRGLTALEFVREINPDLIAISHFPMSDPDGVDAKIVAAAIEQKDLMLPALFLKYEGVMAGCGPVFRVRKSSVE